ncbi:MAG: hypothetical protein QXE32_06730 [Sulfolobales archaeon]
MEEAFGTQILASFGFNAGKIPRIAFSNHRLLVFGDYAEILGGVGILLCFDVRSYSQLLKS